MTVQRIIDLFKLVDPFLNPCRGCGAQPRFFYMDTCTTRGTIAIDHKTTTNECRRYLQDIDLMILSYHRDPEFYIRKILYDMTCRWNEVNPRV